MNTYLPYLPIDILFNFFVISPQVRLVRLVGIMLIIYVKASHYQHVRNIEDQEVATGILGYFGNKGGVAVRYRHENEHYFRLLL